MTNFGYYTQSGTGPLSWAAVRRNTQRASDVDFDKHASKFYKSSGKKLLPTIFRNIKRTGQNKPRKVFQRPGNVGLGTWDQDKRIPFLLLAAAAFLLYRKYG